MKSTLQHFSNLSTVLFSGKTGKTNFNKKNPLKQDYSKWRPTKNHFFRKIYWNAVYTNFFFMQFVEYWPKEHFQLFKFWSKNPRWTQNPKRRSKPIKSFFAKIMAEYRQKLTNFILCVLFVLSVYKNP
jgi:hypothetical protein